LLTNRRRKRHQSFETRSDWLLIFQCRREYPLIHRGDRSVDERGIRIFERSCCGDLSVLIDDEANVDHSALPRLELRRGINRRQPLA
jgi:hypothetical protein